MKSAAKRVKLEAPLHAANVLDSLLAALGASPEQARLRRLWENWDMVMGPELASLAAPLGERRGLLLIGAPDSIAMQELHLQSEEILERVNAFMESPFFTAVNVSLVPQTVQSA